MLDCHTWGVYYSFFKREELAILPYDIIYPIDPPFTPKYSATDEIIYNAVINSDRFDAPSEEKPYVVASPMGYGLPGAKYTLRKVERTMGLGTCNLIRCRSGWNPSDSATEQLGHSSGNRGLVAMLPKNVHFSKALPLP